MKTENVLREWNNKPWFTAAMRRRLKKHVERIKNAKVHRTP